MLRLFPVAAATAILLAAALAHGIRINRWGPAADLDAAAARLAAVPDKVGEWEGQAFELDARQIAIARVTGHLARRYVHRHTGAEVSVLILCGRPGSVSVHTPDICYAGAGYQAGAISKRPLAGGDSVWVATFTKPGPAPDPLRIAWAWSDSDNWQAADSPRVAFSGASVLYKLYVIRRLARADESAELDPSMDFLGLLLPELRRCLSPTS